MSATVSSCFSISSGPTRCHSKAADRVEEPGGGGISVTQLELRLAVSGSPWRSFRNVPRSCSTRDGV
jgi:hypothetical protein